ncbi:hypothetical protein ACUOJT_24880, partial [Escherichia coli]
LTFQNHTNCPLTDFGGKRVFLVILFTSFSGSLVSRISGAVHSGKLPDLRQEKGRILLQPPVSSGDSAK